MWEDATGGRGDLKVFFWGGMLLTFRDLAEEEELARRPKRSVSERGGRLKWWGGDESLPRVTWAGTRRWGPKGKSGGRVLGEGHHEERQRESVVCGWRTRGQGRIYLFILGGCLILRHPGMLMEWFNGKQEIHDWERGRSLQEWSPELGEMRTVHQTVPQIMSR